MQIASVYILLDDGRCIFNHSLIPNPPPYLLVTGLLSALQNFVIEVSNSSIKSFVAGQYSFQCEQRGPIQIVIAYTTYAGSKMNFEFTLRQIGLRFINKYGDFLEDWEGDTVVFDDFIDDLEEILGPEILKYREVTPTDPLTSFTLVKLNQHLQETAQAIVQIKIGSAEEIKEITGRTIYQTQIDLDQLVELGHIGRYQDGRTWKYFI